MPKKSKGKRGGGGRGPPSGEVGSDDDGSMFNDTDSMISLQSEASTVTDDLIVGGAVDDGAGEDAYEEKMKDALDLASEKATATRTKGLEALCSGLLKRYMPDFIDNQKMTITDIVEKSLKKGKGSEIKAAAKLSVLLAIQVFDPEEIYKVLNGTMSHYVSDNTQSPAARASVASGLAGLCFIGGGELAEVVKIMKILENTFFLSAPKKDGSVPSLGPEVTGLHTACLSAWTLLATLLSPTQIFELANSCVTRLEGLFLSTDVELRIAAGEAMVMLLETAYDFDEDYEPENFEGLVKTLKQLATDSSKAKSKKDRKEQRSSFRDVLRGVEEGEPPNETIKFGREILKIDSWFRKAQYDWFCKMMGAGMNYHLGVNSMIREIFDLGAPLIVDANSTFKPSKTERNAANQYAFKMRTQHRSKNRDKRSAVV